MYKHIQIGEFSFRYMDEKPLNIAHIDILMKIHYQLPFYLARSNNGSYCFIIINRDRRVAYNVCMELGFDDLEAFLSKNISNRMILNALQEYGTDLWNKESIRRLAEDVYSNYYNEEHEGIQISSENAD